MYVKQGFSIIVLNWKSKQLSICFALVLLNLAAFSQEKENITGLTSDFTHHCLLQERFLTLGLAIPYSLDLEAVGINARMYYNLNESICFGPEYSYFKNQETEVIDFDFVGHYIFETPWVGIYPLLGINYTIEKEVDHNETLAETGLVYGVGAHRNTNDFMFFLEFSMVEFGIKDKFITGGLYYNL